MDTPTMCEARTLDDILITWNGFSTKLTTLLKNGWRITEKISLPYDFISLHHEQSNAWLCFSWQGMDIPVTEEVDYVSIKENFTIDELYAMILEKQKSYPRSKPKQLPMAEIIKMARKV